MRGSAVWAVAAFAAGSCLGDFKIDFGLTSQTPQAGWRPLGWSSSNVAGPTAFEYDDVDPLVAADGSLSVTLSAGTSAGGTDTMCARDRGATAGGFALDSVYRDFVNPNSNQRSLWLEISGLVPGGAYDVRAYAFDMNNSGTVSFSQYHGGKDIVIASFNYSKEQALTSETDPDVSSALLSGLVADSSGNMTIRFLPTNKDPAVKVSGLVLSRNREAERLDLLIDFGPSSDTALAPGAREFSYSESTEPRTVSYGHLPREGAGETVTVTLTSVTPDKTFILRDRKTNGIDAYADVFPGYALYRDCAITSGGGGMWIDVSGLAANGKYQVTVCPYDWAYGRTYTVADWTSGSAGASQTFTESAHYVFSADTPVDALATSFPVRSDGDGCIRLKNTVASGEAAVAWMRIAYLPPTKGLSIFVR